MQTQGSRASWLVHGQYCKGALPSTCRQGAFPGPAASAPTRLPHRAFLTSTQPSTASPGPAPICLPRFTPWTDLETRGGTRSFGAGEVPETCCSLTMGTRPPFQAGGTDLKRPHLRGEPSVPASLERAEVGKKDWLHPRREKPRHPFPGSCAVTREVHHYVSHKHRNRSQILAGGRVWSGSGLGNNEMLVSLYW